MSIEELDLFKGLRAGIVTAQVRVHPQEEIEGSGTFSRKKRRNGAGEQRVKNRFSTKLLTEFYTLDHCFSTSTMLRSVDFNSWHSLASILDGEFWEIKSTDFKVAEAEKH